MVTAAEQMTQLAEAIRNTTGERRSGAMLAHYTAAGLTVERVEQIRRLAVHAVEVGSLIVLPEAPGGRDPVLVAGGTVLMAVIAGVEHGADMEASLAWAGVLVAEPDPERVESMRFGIGMLDQAWRAAGPDRPLAYAAGLTVEEAQARLAVGTLDIDGLGALAALRGYRLLPSS